MGEAESEFYALPIEKRTTATKQKVISSKLGKAAALETECNANMDSLLAELSNELKAQGKDLSLVSSIKKAYANEKQLKKSYYINQYLN